MPIPAPLRVPVPPGVEGPARLLPALATALAGESAGLAPVPTISATVTNAYVMSILEAVRLDEPLESEDIALIVSTSGSTGRPRGVLHTAASLSALASAANGDGSPQWVLALPVASIGGINVLVRALAADRDPVVVPSIGGAGPFTSELFAQAVDDAAQACDDIRVSLVPAQVARLMADEAGVDALQRCSQVLVGGGPLRPSLRAVAEHHGVRLVSTYGATETAGGCVYDGVPLPGVVVDADPGTGLLTIAGHCVARGYRCRPDLTVEAFSPRGFRTGDVGRVDDGHVTVLGRADDIVTVGGVNVSVVAVEQTMADHPDIEAVAVVAVPEPLGESALHAFVVVRDAAPHAGADAARAAQDRLGRPARPHVHEVARLPRLPHGKVDRARLAQWAQTGQEEA